MAAKNILIVEDDDDLRLKLKNILNTQGYITHLCSDGVGAIVKLIENDIDLILTDYRMEFLGGNYWVGFLKKFCADKKIIFISGFLDSSDEFPYPIIFKPFDMNDLLNTIKNTLNWFYPLKY